MKKPDLKIVPKKEVLSDESTFWNTCPRLLEFLPESICESGKDTCKNVKSENYCEWWINSEKHNYCFWKYVHDMSTPDGVMTELIHSDLAKLFGWSSTKIHFAIKEAMEELNEALIKYEAEALIAE